MSYKADPDLGAQSQGRQEGLYEFRDGEAGRASEKS